MNRVPVLSISRRVRSTPYTRRVEEAGVTAYTVYNHMLLPAVFESLETDYWHLCEHVQVWDVAGERQVEVAGPDSARLVQLMTPRDLSKQDVLQGKYAPLCDAKGRLINDPIVIKLAEDRWWFSIADSDVKLWAKGLAQGYGMDVEVFEPDVSPLAVQGPKAEELMARVFGDVVRSIRFFRGEMLEFQSQSMYVARSGWSKQGGFEIYLPDSHLGEDLWDALFAAGEDLQVRAGCPNLIERVESGLLSYGNDMTENDTPFDCGLDAFLKLDADIDSLSLPALRAMAGKSNRQLIGLSFPQTVPLDHLHVYDGDEWLGDITTHVWSPRYERHLALFMAQREAIKGRTHISVHGVQGKICPVPFDLDDL